MLKEMDHITEDVSSEMPETKTGKIKQPSVFNRSVRIALTTAALTVPMAGCKPDNSGLINPTPEKSIVIAAEKPIRVEQVFRNQGNQMYPETDWQKWDEMLGEQATSVIDYSVQKGTEKQAFTLIFSEGGSEKTVVFFNNNRDVIYNTSTLMWTNEKGNYVSWAVNNNDGSSKDFFIFKITEIPEITDQSNSGLDTAILKAISPDNVEAVIFVDYVTNNEIIYSSDDPEFIDIGTDTPTPGNSTWNNFVYNFQTGFNFNLSAQAEGLPTPIPTETPSPTPLPTEIPTDTASPTPIETSTPTRTRTPLPTLTRTPTNEPTVTPFPTYTPVPTEVPTITEVQPNNRERNPVNPQNHTLSCEAASIEILTERVNAVRKNQGLEEIAVPNGYATFEEFYIARTGLADNPVEGYCGDIDGGLSLNCDASSGLGYGVYNEPLMGGLRELGIPAEAITIKDIVAGKEQLRKILIDSYNNDQVLALWGRWDDGTHPVEWWTNPRTGEQYPMAYGEHCIAGQVISADGKMIEISDPLPYGKGSRRVYTFNTLYNWMSQIGWFMAIRVG